jgi:hypothetical protein
MLNILGLDSLARPYDVVKRFGVGKCFSLTAALRGTGGASGIGLAVLVCLIATEASFAAEYYVSASGSDNNPGTEAKPFRNPQAAAAVVNPGDIVYLMNGVYAASTSDKRVMNLVRSGTKENMITFRNYPGHKPQIGRLPATTADQYGFVALGADYIRFEGLTFVGTEQGCLYIASIGENGSEGIEVVNNTFLQCGRAHQSCRVDYGHNALDAGPYTQGMLTDGNIFRDSGRTIDRNCDLLSSTENHQYRHDHAVYLKGKGHIFRNNLVLDYPAGYGVKIDGYKKSLGQTLAPNFSHKIINNTFGPNTSQQPYDQTSGHPVGLFNSTPDSYDPRWLIANNVFVDPVRSGSKEPTTVFIRDNSTQNWPTGNECRNNITTGIEATATCGEYVPNIAKNVLVRGNSLGVTEMRFLSPTNFRLTEASPAVGHGDATVAPPTDLEGKSRELHTGIVDSGAYELSSGVSPEPRTAPNPPKLSAVQTQ